MGQAWKETYPERYEKLVEKYGKDQREQNGQKYLDFRCSEAGSKTYKEIKSRSTFQGLLEQHGIDMAYLIKKGKDLMEMERPYFGGDGAVEWAPDGPTQVRAWEKMLAVTGNDPTAKVNINVNNQFNGPVKIEWGSFELDADNMEISFPRSDES